MAGPGEKRAIIIKEDILSEEYIPERISGREDQMAIFRTLLSPAFRNQRPIPVWIYGKPGSGKTVAARHLGREIHSGARVHCVHVNCRKYNSVYSLLDHILKELRAGFGDERDKRVKLERLEQTIGERPAIFILDEIDFLPARERSTLLYSLCFGKVGLVCISEDRDALLSLNGRTKSRFQPQPIEFPPYSKAETMEILQQRAIAALAPESWNTQRLQRISILSKGDARTAIQTLRNSAEIAEVECCGEIRTNHIEAAFVNTNGLKKDYALKKLGDHCTMLYRLISGSGEILSTELWNSYSKECKAKGLPPVAKRTYSLYLNRMARMKLIEAKRARVRGHVFSFSIKGMGGRSSSDSPLKRSLKNY